MDFHHAYLVIRLGQSLLMKVLLRVIISGLQGIPWNNFYKHRPGWAPTFLNSNVRRQGCHMVLTHPFSGDGSGQSKAWGYGLSYDDVKINAEYTGLDVPGRLVEHGCEGVTDSNLGSAGMFSTLSSLWRFVQAPLRRFQRDLSRREVRDDGVTSS